VAPIIKLELLVVVLQPAVRGRGIAVEHTSLAGCANAQKANRDKIQESIIFFIGYFVFLKSEIKIRD
jgi:hypothetical protein